jgi:subtilisin-like proprotein convertase family protein
MPFRTATNCTRSLRSRRCGAIPRLGLEPLEQRRLLHAGHDHDEADPVVQMGMVGVLPGDEAPAIGAEPLHALSDIPALNSLPGAAVSVYLDFDGHFETVWGTHTNVSTPVYSRDADFGSFSDSELLAIQQIWAQVAEDFSPFKINVTTVEPPSFANGVAVRVSIGGNGSWTDGTYGGIAYVNSFTNSIVNTVYVFPANLSNGNAKNVAEASSHETGHAFGLDHQSLWTGSIKTAEYYTGPGNGTAPIMGNSYSATRGLWWQGTSSNGPTSIQDDLAVISSAQNGFGYRVDDYGDTAATAAPLPSVGGVLTASGVITTTSDVDYFSFDTGAGQVTLQVTLPARNNLDTRLELRDAAGVLITSAAPTNSFGATIVANLTAGSYRVVVASQGNYGDVGQYTLTADVLAPAVEGVVYLDANRDGVRNESEAGLAGATVFDDLNSNGVWDAAPQYLLSANSLPLAIPERGAIRPSIITSGLTGTILDVNVRISLQHGNISDLVLSLTDPDGMAVSLMALNPAGGQVMADTHFDSDAATAISAALPPYTGTFRPFGNLAALVGRNPNGEWKLLVSDLNLGNSGVLEDFQIELTTSAPEPKTTTNALGEYLFTFAGSGLHHFRQADQPGYFQTAPGASGYDVLVTAETPVVGLDFGNSPPAVVERRLFYNASTFDGGDAAINAADDQAIAPDKIAYLPGSGLATFASVSSYTRGINGLIIDVGGLAGEITAGDFIFRVGANNAPSSWQTAPAPSALQVRPGAGLGGTDRIEIVWSNGAIVNKWLEVVVRGNDALGGFNANTGLAESDVFYWGNKIGDSGTSPGSNTFDTTSTDAAQVFSTIGPAKPISDLRDYNRDGHVSSTDAAVVFANIGSLLRIDVSAAAPFAPIASPAIAPSDERRAGVALALAVAERKVVLLSSAGTINQQASEAPRGIPATRDQQLVSSDAIQNTLSRARAKAFAEAFVSEDLLGDLLA